jgi:hypothetical protein
MAVIVMGYEKLVDHPQKCQSLGKPGNQRLYRPEGDRAKAINNPYQGEKNAQKGFRESKNKEKNNSSEIKIREYMRRQKRLTSGEWIIEYITSKKNKNLVGVKASTRKVQDSAMLVLARGAGQYEHGRVL